MRDALVRLGSAGLIFLGLGLLALAAWQYYAPPDGPGVDVDEPTREIADCSVGETKEIVFSIHNRAAHPVQVVGIAPC